jgi:protein involved in polysaccharide export with SLBB domain
VDDDGAAPLPYLGSRKLAGMTTAQAESEIARAYKEAGVIAGAQVDVRRIEAGSRVTDASGGKLAPGDLVEVSVDDLTGPGATAEFHAHVGADGEVAVPLLGPIKLVGMTPGQAERAVAKEYQTRGVIRNGVIGVRVIEPAGRAKVKPGPIGKGDLLSLAANGLTGPGARTEFKARVGADGAIGFPWIGAVRVEGLSEAQAVAAIAKAMREQRVEEGPIVAVWREQSADQADVKLGPVAPGEVLRVGITDLAGPGVETVKAVRVDDKGLITMPLVGAVKVDGLTESAVASAIAKAYRDRNLIASANVTVLKINGAAALPDDELQPLTPAAPGAAGAV